MAGSQVLVVHTAAGERVFVNGVLLAGARLVATSATRAIVSFPVGQLTIETEEAPPAVRRIALGDSE